MSADVWLDRADRSFRSAEVTLRDGDPNGSCSLAYYAMFYAAKAALIAAGQEQAAAAKTHSGLIAAFSQHLVRTGGVAVEQGGRLSKEANRRLLASYEGDIIDSRAAAEAIDHATAFIVAVREWAAGRSPTDLSA